MGRVVDSPRAEYHGSGRPEERRNRGELMRRGVIIILLLLVVALNLLAWRSQDAGALLSNEASRLEGVVVGDDGAPLSGARVFVAGTEHDQEGASDTRGRFALERVPAGSQTLVVAHRGVAQEFDLEIVPGRVNNAGTVSYRAPAEPFEVQPLAP